MERGKGNKFLCHLIDKTLTELGLPPSTVFHVRVDSAEITFNNENERSVDTGM